MDKELKDVFAREINHILLVEEKKNKSAGYNIDSDSNSAYAVKTLLRLKLIECTDIIKTEKSFFVFVKATDKLIKK